MCAQKSVQKSQLRQTVCLAETRREDLTNSNGVPLSHGWYLRVHTRLQVRIDPVGEIDLDPEAESRTWRSCFKRCVLGQGQSSPTTLLVRRVKGGVPWAYTEDRARITPLAFEFDPASGSFGKQEWRFDLKTAWSELNSPTQGKVQEVYETTVFITAELKRDKLESGPNQPRQYSGPQSPSFQPMYYQPTHPQLSEHQHTMFPSPATTQAENAFHTEFFDEELLQPFRASDPGAP